MQRGVSLSVLSDHLLESFTRVGVNRRDEYDWRGSCRYWLLTLNVLCGAQEARKLRNEHYDEEKASEDPSERSYSCSTLGGVLGSRDVWLRCDIRWGLGRLAGWQSELHVETLDRPIVGAESLSRKAAWSRMLVLRLLSG